MNNFQTVIGIEVHTVVKSNSKMFSATKSCHTDPVNTNINEVDIGLPGALPTVNEEVVMKAICLANALHMTIAPTVSFDRKNYFYRDLPKGYQITQQFNPIGTDGYVEINVGDKQKRIRIERIHMEEDTAKQLKTQDKVLLDYNRSGMPLIEIVSKPDIASAQEAMAYLTQLKRILNFCGEISDAKMEEGSLRADVNISINLHGTNQYGTRVEIKNLNSIANVGKAIEYEADRQAKAYVSGQVIKAETRRYDDVKGETIYMRDKTAAVDYHFMPEPNLLEFKLDQKFIDDAKAIAKYPLEEFEAKLNELGLDQIIINQLLDDYPLYKVFAKVVNATHDVNQAMTWVMIELVGLLKKDNKTIEIISEKQIGYIIDLINLIMDQKINARQGKVVMQEIYKDSLDPIQSIKNHGFKQIVNPNEIAALLQPIIDSNKDIVSQYDKRPERVEKMILGLLMKQTQGQANPVISTQVLRQLIKK